MSFGDRLREERNRLGLIQSDAAKAGGVGFTAYHTYEKGDRSPNVEVLQKWHEAGFDVLYLVTGVRNGAALSNEDSSLLAALNQTDERGRATAIAALRGALNAYSSFS
ncbi:helix-turn-helix transcriptional regulator [Chromobacterium amazonense]|uniref:helix-turn-helix domain-containing protein n=1 Tax=Chromobacterium amazonense TaxID=1382803 RepID=UPI00237D653A|nr:helix-turn-helix transcriptional regulator [Chromobacterium amazonense]MDE1716266.1 helix-turn-helix transcriptional regulator [Chromobacterium amazonense]